MESEVSRIRFPDGAVRVMTTSDRSPEAGADAGRGPAGWSAAPPRSSGRHGRASTQPPRSSGRHGRALPAIRAVTLLALAACRGEPSGQDYGLEIPNEWVATVTHDLYPLAPGTTWRYESTAAGGETVLVEVLDDTRVVNGVLATVVRDRVYEDGELVEDTDDWFAQDMAGNVWYLGEDSKEVENGEVAGTAGSWEWGADGALPGIIMWADPARLRDLEYRQEYRPGVAEDWGTVVSIDQTVTVPAGTFTGCITTEDWSGIEPGRERKSYCPGVGLVLEQSGGGRLELVSVERRGS